MHSWLICTLLTLALACSTVRAQQPVSTPGIAFTHISVIDTSTGRVARDMTVILSGDRIAEVAAARQVRLPAGIRTIAGTGKFLVPGLWDMHVHVFLEGAAAGNLVFMPTKRYFQLLVANGITGVRDTGGTETPEQLATLRRASVDGSSFIPKVIAAGPVVDGPKPIWPFSVTVATAEEGRNVVGKLQSEGFDFVKVYSALPREPYFGIAAEARRRNFVFAGHVPDSISALEASNAGQKSIEHLNRVLSACSSQEEEFNAMYRDAVAKGEPTGAVYQKTRAMLLPSFSKSKAAALFDTFAKNQTWQVPTFTLLRSSAYLDDAALTNDRRLAYVPAAVRKSWDPNTDFRYKARSAGDWKLAKELYAKHLEIAGEMHRRGVPFMAGTDLGNPYIFPGFSLHDELSILVSAGFGTLEALQTATINPARFMGKESDFGSIERGKMADLVLLDANPLDNIENIRRIHAVVLSGTFIGRDQLDSLLREAETEAKSR